MLTGTVDTHQLFPYPTIHCSDAKTLVHVISQMDHTDLALTQQTPQHTLHPEETTRRNTLHQLSLVN